MTDGRKTAEKEIIPARCWTLHDQEWTVEACETASGGVSFHAEGPSGTTPCKYLACHGRYRMDSPWLYADTASARSLCAVLTGFIDRVTAGEPMPMDLEQRGRWLLRDQRWMFIVCEWDGKLGFVVNDTKSPFKDFVRSYGKKKFYAPRSMLSPGLHIDPDSARALRDLLDRAIASGRETAR